MRELIEHREGINRLMARYGVKFGIYKNNEFHEQLFPFDPMPRVISAKEFEFLQKGLTQRVDALNAFLADVYGEKKIVKDKVIPEDFIFSRDTFHSVKGSSRRKRFTATFPELISFRRRMASGTSSRIT